MLSALLTVASAVLDAAGVNGPSSNNGGHAESLFGSLSGEMVGCSLCKKVAAMPPEQQRVFYSILAVVGALFALLTALFFLFRAKLVPGLVYDRRAHHPFCGVFLDLSRHYSSMNTWKSGLIRGIMDRHRQATMHALMQVGKDGAAIEAEVGASTPELVNWSIPFSAPFVDVVSARNLKYMLSDNFTNFVKGQLLHDSLNELLGDGIFNTDGASWRQQRKIASHLFSFNKLNDHMFQVFSAESEKLVSVLDAAARSGAEIDFQQQMFDFTFDSICRIAFGVEMKQLGSKAPHPFCAAFDDVQAIMTARSCTPPMKWKLMRFLNVGSERRLAKHMRVINSFIDGIVRDRKKNLAEYEDDGDLLSLFMQDAAKRGEEIRDLHLRSLILNFMVAGRDTTAVALTWLFYAFDQHPAEQAACVDEVRSTLSSSVEPTAEAIKSLQVLEAAFMESTRMWPPVPADIKECVSDCTFPCGARIPKGCVMVYTPIMLNHLPSYYESTTGLKHWAADCDEFRSARWLVEDADTKRVKVLQPSAYDFVTFNAGLRLCLGKSMAILEAKVVASSILQQFRIVVRPGYVPQERVSIVYLMRQGLPVTVHFRK